MDAIDCQIQDKFGFYTRTTDGVSGMTVTALADFCGVEQPAISQMLNKIRDFDPITKDLPKCLESFAGKEWRLITNDEQNSLFVIDELCHAILEYYAIDARKYKGKQIAVKNYRTIAKAGLRVFIWSQTGYSPHSLSQEQFTLLNSIPAMQKTIAQLQAQVQNLLPPPANFIPPGWDADVWEKLPPQDKRHFCYLHRRRKFRPDNHNEDDSENLSVLKEQVKQRQKDELRTVIGQVSPEEKERLEAAKKQALKLFREA
ncbi:KilA-like protein [Calothrix sp. NIES-4101]|nr:KilA-like protein [Calothrix sp. NIES-4101]